MDAAHPGGGADAQGQLRRQERVRHDPELQGHAGCLHQAKDHRGALGFLLPRMNEILLC